MTKVITSHTVENMSNTTLESLYSAYHQKCVDPWLTKNKKTCPICKRKVIPGEESSDSDDTDSDEYTERTPLIRQPTRNIQGEKAEVIYIQLIVVTKLSTVLD